MKARGAIAVMVLLAVALGVVALAPREAANPGFLIAGSATPQGEAFRAGFRPLLERAVAEAEALVAMGDDRERNLLRIRSGQNAMTEALAAADGWLATHPPAPADTSSVDAYQNGAAAVRTAMGEAQAGFLHLDFERVAAATETMRQGADALARAVSLLAD